MLATAACTNGGDAVAMSGQAEHQWCRVSNDGQLPDEVGGPEAVCAALTRALAPVSPKPSGVEVKVVSRYLLSVSVTLASGRRLPEIKVGSSDAPLDPQAIRMLADSVATRVAREQQR